MIENRLSVRLKEAIEQCHLAPAQVHGRLQRVKGLCLEATGCRLSTGQRCLIEGRDGLSLEAEVVGFEGNRLFLMPLQQPVNLSSGDRVTPIYGDNHIPVGVELLGRVINGVGEPIDGKGALNAAGSTQLQGEPLNPLTPSPYIRTSGCWGQGD